MCSNIGVDPLASNKGTWNKLLGFGGGRPMPPVPPPVPRAPPPPPPPAGCPASCSSLAQCPLLQCPVTHTRARTAPSLPLLSAFPSLPADFYYELGVQLVEACITSRPFTGGLMELSLVLKYVQVGGWEWVGGWVGGCWWVSKGGWVGGRLGVWGRSCGMQLWEVGPFSHAASSGNTGRAAPGMHAHPPSSTARPC